MDREFIEAFEPQIEVDEPDEEAQPSFPLNILQFFINLFLGGGKVLSALNLMKQTKLLKRLKIDEGSMRRSGLKELIKLFSLPNNIFCVYYVLNSMHTYF